MHRREFIRQASALTAAAMTGSCQSMTRSQESTRRLATFCCDVTPPLGTPIYSSFKPLAVIEFPLLAKGVILDDGGTRYVLCAVDWCEICNSTHTEFREKIAEAAGTDPSRVAVQTVHQHTAPMGDGDAMRLIEQIPDPPPHPSPSVFDEAVARVAAAVRESVSKFTPFDQIGLGQAKVERVASNRRVPAGDGKVGFRASSCKDPKLIELPEGLIDPMLKTITFSLGTKPLVRMHYYATHPQSFYGDPRASYDFPGMAREKLEQQEGVLHIYFNGCGGNIAAGKYNDASPEARDGLFQRLFAGMEASVAVTKFQPAGTFTWRSVPVLFTLRDDGSFTEAEARARMANASLAASTRLDGAMLLAFRARSQTPIELSSLQIGDMFILHLPGEAAIEFQLDAQKLKPEAFVAIAAYGDCATGYICLERFFDEGGYEPTASHIIPKSEQTFRDAIGRLLGVA